MAAGVFSTCVKTSSGCCADPVIYERINDEMKKWIWDTAPGVRESHGCPKKKSRMYITNISILGCEASLFVGLLVASVSVCMCHLYIKLNP